MEVRSKARVTTPRFISRSGCQPHRADLSKLLVHRRARRQGVGDIPGYALLPRGGLCSTTVFYRELAVTPASRDE